LLPFLLLFTLLLLLLRTLLLLLLTLFVLLLGALLVLLLSALLVLLLGALLVLLLRPLLSLLAWGGVSGRMWCFTMSRSRMRFLMLFLFGKYAIYWNRVCHQNQRPTNC
jgi:hypothetical protein